MKKSVRKVEWNTRAKDPQSPLAERTPQEEREFRRVQARRRKELQTLVRTDPCFKGWRVVRGNRNRVWYLTSDMRPALRRALRFFPKEVRDSFRRI